MIANPRPALPLVSDVGDSDADWLSIVDAFAMSCPAPRCGDVASDFDRFLSWLSTVAAGRTDRPAPVIDDSLPPTLRLSLERRLAQARFQQVAAQTSHRWNASDAPGQLWVHLNPAHVWARHQPSDRLSSRESESSEVLLCAVGDEVCATVLDADLVRPLRRLAEAGPQRLHLFARRISGWRRDEVVAKVRELCDRGVLAVV